MNKINGKRHTHQGSSSVKDKVFENEKQLFKSLEPLNRRVPLTSQATKTEGADSCTAAKPREPNVIMINLDINPAHHRRSNDLGMLP